MRTIAVPDSNVSNFAQARRAAVDKAGEDGGTKFLCLNEACTEEDRQKLGYLPGGGIGG